MATSHSVDYDLIETNSRFSAPNEGMALNCEYKLPKPNPTHANSPEKNPSVALSVKSRSPSPPSPYNIITINVSGLRFQTFVETLERFPTTLLGNPRKRDLYYNAKLGEYFFDRHRSSFEAIIYYYQSEGRRLKRPQAVPLDIFINELRYFELGETAIKKLWTAEGFVQPKEIMLPKNRFQRWVWLTMEHPDSSLLARVLAFVSVFVIVISTMSFCLETIPELREEVRNRSLSSAYENNSMATSDVIVAEGGEDFENPFFIVEFTCMCWFTLEFLLRFFSSPSKLEFCKSFLNVIDFVAIVPFFVNLAWAGARGAGGTMPFAVLRIFRLVRVFRIFKLSRHSRGLQILGKTFRASVQELCLLVFFLCLGLVLFSSAIYITESGLPGTKFSSIPASFWYVIITMTTVGYGDLVPVGPLGKLVGGTCAIMGVLVLALPVPVIVANFKHYYKQERHLARMRAIECDDNEYLDGDSVSS